MWVKGVLESESDKEKHWLLVAELGDVLEKVLIYFGKLFQRIGVVRLYERLDILREEMVKGRSRMRWLKDRVEPAGLKLISFLRFLGLRCMEKVIRKRDDFVMGVLFYFEPVQRFEYRNDMFNFGVPVTARAREFCSSWRRDICFCGQFR